MVLATTATAIIVPGRGRPAKNKSSIRSVFLTGRRICKDFTPHCLLTSRAAESIAIGYLPHALII
jgi:hypothetical protein